MKYSPAAFSTKWKQRFVPNDEFKIVAADLQEFTQDTADSFGVSVANVPAYVAGSTYAVGYLVRYGSAQGRESFYYALKAGLLPAPTYQVSDANWKLVPGPVAPTVFTQAITLLEASSIEGDSVAVRLYAITGSPVPGVSNPEVGCWNQDGQTRTLYVWGYENWWGQLGVLLDADGRPAHEVAVDVAAGTYVLRPARRRWLHPALVVREADGLVEQGWSYYEAGREYNRLGASFDNASAGGYPTLADAVAAEPGGWELMSGGGAGAAAPELEATFDAGGADTAKTTVGSKYAGTYTTLTTANVVTGSYTLNGGAAQPLAAPLTLAPGDTLLLTIQRDVAGQGASVTFS